MSRTSTWIPVALLVIAAVAVVVAVGTVSAATPVDSCQTISDAGTYELTTHIQAESSYTCIVIAASDVTLTGNGYTINGSDVPNPQYGQKTGIEVDATASNVEIQDVRLVGWGRGIQVDGDDARLSGIVGDDSIFVAGNGTHITDSVLDDGHGVVLLGDDNRLSDSTVRNGTYGVVLAGANNTATGNFFADTSSSAISISDGRNNTALDNHVERGRSSTEAGGINVDGGTDHTLANNTVLDTTNGMGVRVTTSNTTVVDNTVSNSSSTGLWIVNADGSLVANNTVLASGRNLDRHGLRLSGSDDAIVRGNYVRGSPENAIVIESADNVTVAGNDVGDVMYYGIGLAERSSNGPVTNSVVQDNVVTDTRYAAIHLSDATQITVRNNTVTNPTDRPEMTGIGLTYSTNHNTVVENTISGVDIGIRVQSSDNHTVTRNHVTESGSYGLYVSQAEDTLLFDNYLENDDNVHAWSGSDVAYNVTKQPGPNVVGGPHLGGNYYANATGTGYSQTCDDSDDDGLCDSPIQHDIGHVDHHPLAAGASNPTPTPTPTPSPTPTPTSTTTPTPTATATPTPTSTPTPTATSTATATATSQSTSSSSSPPSSSSSSSTSSPTVTATRTVTPTNTSPTPATTPSVTSTATSTATPAPRASNVDDAGSPTDDQAGFGPWVAVVALLSGALWFRQR